jgi:hypothetical protein
MPAHAAALRIPGPIPNPYNPSQSLPEGIYGSASHHGPHRAHQRARTAHSRLHARHRTLVSPGVDGAHAAVLHLGRYPQRGLQAGAGGHQPVPRWLEQSHQRDAAAGRAGRHGRHREDLPRGAQPADHSREPHAQHVLPGQRGAAAAHLQHGGSECAGGLHQSRDQKIHPDRAAQRRFGHAGARGAHQGALGLKDFDPCTILLNNDLSAGAPGILEDLHEQYLLPPLHAGWSVRRKSTTSRTTKRWPSASARCWASTPG